MQMKRVLMIVTMTFMILFLWEHVARTHSSNMKPSVGITFVADYAKLLFHMIGSQFSRLSSFLTYIKLDELYITAYDLIKPSFELLWSPLQAVKGYWDIAMTYKYPGSIALGSIVLCVSCMYLGHRYRRHIPTRFMFWTR